MIDRAPKPAVDQSAALGMFTALSQASRLAVFLQVLSAGPAGASAQGLAAALGTTGSALTLHLRALEAAGLIHVPIRRRGQQGARVVARIDRFNGLGTWMANHCRETGWSADAMPTGPILVRQNPSVLRG